jgi:hypothetical protein
VTQTKASPKTISAAVPSGFFTTKALSIAMAAAVSVPPIQIGVETQ